MTATRLCSYGIVVFDDIELFVSAWIITSLFSDEIAWKNLRRNTKSGLVPCYFYCYICANSQSVIYLVIREFLKEGIMGNNVYSILCPGMNPRGLIPLIVNPNAPRHRGGKRSHGFNSMAPMGSKVDDAYIITYNSDDTDDDSDSFGSNSDLTEPGVKLWNHSSIIRDSDNNIPVVVNQNGLNRLPNNVDIRNDLDDQSKDLFDKINIRVNPFDELNDEEDHNFKDPTGDSGICDQTEADYMDLVDGNNHVENNFMLEERNNECRSPPNDLDSESNHDHHSGNLSPTEEVVGDILFQKCHYDSVRSSNNEPVIAAQESLDIDVYVKKSNSSDKDTMIKNSSSMQINQPLSADVSEKAPSNLDLSKKRVSFQDKPESITLPNEDDSLSQTPLSPRPKKKKTLKKVAKWSDIVKKVQEQSVTSQETFFGENNEVCKLL